MEKIGEINELDNSLDFINEKNEDIIKNQKSNVNKEHNNDFFKIKEEINLQLSQTITEDEDEDIEEDIGGDYSQLMPDEKTK